MPDYVTESVIRPAALLTRDAVRAIYEDCRNKTLVAARQSLGPAVRLIVRSMLPSDLGETDNIWADQTSGTSSAYENSIINNQVIANERFVGVYGAVYSGTQAVSVVRFTVKARILAYWDFSCIISGDERLESRTAYTLSPFVIPQNIAVTIESYTRLAGGSAQSTEIAYQGIVVEKAGRTIDA